MPVSNELTEKELNISASDQHIGSERTDRLYEAINRLNAVEKAIIILYLEDYQYKEIAEVTGISENNVGVRIKRIKEKLVKLLENEND